MNKTGVGDKDNQPVVEEPVEEEPVEVEEPEEKPVKKKNSGVFVIVLLVIGGAAGAYLYITNSKAKKPANTGVDPDADYNEDEEDYLSSIPEDDEDYEIPDIDEDDETSDDDDEE